MALLPCPECGCATSSLAEKCPQCGRPVATFSAVSSPPGAEVEREVIVSNRTELADIISNRPREVEDLTLMFSDVDDDDLVGLTRLPNLTRVSITLAEDISDAGLVAIAKIMNLRELELGVGSQRITAAGIRALARLKRLEVLDLGLSVFESKLADAIRYLQKEVPTCVVKHFRGR